MHVPAFFIYYEQNLSNKISGIIIQVLPLTFQFEKAPSQSPYDMIIYEPGAKPADGNNYLTLVDNPWENPLKNITATPNETWATWFVVHQVSA